MIFIRTKVHIICVIMAVLLLMASCGQAVLPYEPTDPEIEILPEHEPEIEPAPITELEDESDKLLLQENFEVIEIPSPDGLYNFVITNEFVGSSYTYSVLSIEDVEKNIKSELEWEPDQMIITVSYGKWSPDSRYIAFDNYARRFCYTVIYDTEKCEFKMYDENFIDEIIAKISLHPMTTQGFVMPAIHPLCWSDDGKKLILHIEYMADFHEDDEYEKYESAFAVLDVESGTLEFAKDARHSNIDLSAFYTPIMQKNIFNYNDMVKKIEQIPDTAVCKFFRVRE